MLNFKQVSLYSSILSIYSFTICNDDNCEIILPPFIYCILYLYISTAVLHENFVEGDKAQLSDFSSVSLYFSPFLFMSIDMASEKCVYT
jgi:hypothetical protein